MSEANLVLGREPAIYVETGIVIRQKGGHHEHDIERSPPIFK